MLKALLDGSVVFINEDYSRTAVVLGKCQRQGEKELRIVEWLVKFNVYFSDITFMAVQLIEQHVFNAHKSFFPRGVFHILERKIDNRILSLMFLVFLSARPDFLVSEID